MKTTKFIVLLCLIVTSLFITDVSITKAQDKSATQIVSEDGTATIDAPPVKIRVVYPKGILRSMEPRISPETNRGGSLVSVEFNIKYRNVWLQEILFHTLESCKAFARSYREIEGMEGEGFPESWYSPKDFIQEKKAFYSAKPSRDYGYFKSNGVKFYGTCNYGEPGGYYMYEAATFINDIRATIIIGSDLDCKKMKADAEQLLSKIKFIKQ